MLYLTRLINGVGCIVLLYILLFKAFCFMGLLGLFYFGLLGSTLTELAAREDTPHFTILLNLAFMAWVFVANINLMIR